jgi:hypothetical protein
MVNHIRTALAGLLLPGLLLLGLLPLALALGAGEAWGQTGTAYFLTVKKGSLDPSSSGDTFISEIETTQGHGALVGDRVSQPFSIQFDIYGVSASRVGLDIGLEVLGYNKSFVFADGERVYITVKGMHFTFNTLARLGAFMPFLGFGIGNYYVTLEQSSGLNLRTSPDEVYTAHAGFRVMAGRMGILLEVGITSALADIPGLSGDATLELGGTYTNLGLSWLF